MVRRNFCRLHRPDALGLATIRRAHLNVRFLWHRGSAPTNWRQEKSDKLIFGRRIDDSAAFSSWRCIIRDKEK
jgi:hypothetical protein